LDKNFFLKRYAKQEYDVASDSDTHEEKNVNLVKMIKKESETKFAIKKRIKKLKNKNTHE
jgi:hypothetical protein